MVPARAALLLFAPSPLLLGNKIKSPRQRDAPAYGRPREHFAGTCFLLLGGEISPSEKRDFPCCCLPGSSTFPCRGAHRGGPTGRAPTPTRARGRLSTQKASQRSYLFVLLVSLLGNVLCLCELGLKDAHSVVLHVGSVLQAFAGSEGEGKMEGEWWGRRTDGRRFGGGGEDGPRKGSVQISREEVTTQVIIMIVIID